MSALSYRQASDYGLSGLTGLAIAAGLYFIFVTDWWSQAFSWLAHGDNALKGLAGTALLFGTVLLVEKAKFLPANADPWRATARDFYHGLLEKAVSIRLCLPRQCEQPYLTWPRLPVLQLSCTREFRSKLVTFILVLVASATAGEGQDVKDFTGDSLLDIYLGDLGQDDGPSLPSLDRILVQIRRPSPFVLGNNGRTRFGGGADEKRTVFPCNFLCRPL